MEMRLTLKNGHYHGLQECFDLDGKVNFQCVFIEGEKWIPHEVFETMREGEEDGEENALFNLDQVISEVERKFKDKMDGSLSKLKKR